MHQLKPSTKPRFRGYLHQEAFFTALGACVMLIAKASAAKSTWAASIYSVGVLFMFGISAIYHRNHWQPLARALLKRIDHSAIFLMIACTFTPICLLALSPNSESALLKIIWSAAALGIMQSIFWVKAPKWVTSLFYVVMGWMIVPYLSELRTSLGATGVNLMIVGGAFYTIGALFYATKKPVLKESVFGYHELFHVFTIIAAAFHFAVVYRLIR